MKIFSKIKICLLLTFLFWAGCKKLGKEIEHRYSEDPGTTTLTPQQRLSATWQVKEYTFNGKDLTAALDTFYNGTYHIKDASMWYDQNSDTKKWILSVSAGGYSSDSEINFNPDNPEFLIINNDNRCCKFLKTKWFITPFRYEWNASAKWTITKLFDKELNLVLQTDSGDYKIFFRKTCCVNGKPI